MPGRSFVHPNPDEGYRFGFNGKENDKDFGDQLIQDYGFRLYNPAIGKFLSVDPLAPEYPWYTPYQFAGNMPIAAVDLDGLEPKLSTEEEKSVLTILSNPPADVVAYQAGMSKATWNAATLGWSDWLDSDPYFYSTNPTSQESYLQGRISGDLFMLGLGLGQIHGGTAGMTGSAAAGPLAPAVAIVGGITAAHGAVEATTAVLDLRHSLSLMAGRGSNNLKPDDEAEGDHSTFERDVNGDIYKYETYKASPKKDPKTGKLYFDPRKRFDGGKPNGEQGQPHNGIETPHVQGKDIKKEMGNTDVRRPKRGTDKEPSEYPNNNRFRTPY